MKAWKQLKKIFEAPEQYVDFNEEGFMLKLDGWFFGKLQRERLILWNKVAAIDVSMRDCFAAHIVSLVFFDEKDNYMIHVGEHVKGYDDFTKYVKEKFSGFNCHNFEAIELMFPSDICFPCWKTKKAIGDLEVKREERKILWKDNQEVFLEWKD